eukprot:3631067-Rhodomonas_salina.1
MRSSIAYGSTECRCGNRCSRRTSGSGTECSEFGNRGSDRTSGSGTECSECGNRCTACGGCGNRCSALVLSVRRVRKQVFGSGTECSEGAETGVLAAAAGVRSGGGAPAH